MCIHLSTEKQRTGQKFSGRQKWLRLFLAILLTICFSGSLSYAQDFNRDNIRQIANSLPTDLADPFDKFDLAYNIKAFFLLRQSLVGFARTADLENSFKKAFDIFVKTLYTKDLKNADQTLQDRLLDDMINAYKRNQRDFQRFYKVLQERSPYYSKMTLDTMRRQIVQFVLILNISGTDALAILARFTGIWPFC